MGLIAQLPCVICNSIGMVSHGVEIHHVAEGSGLRRDFADMLLCVPKSCCAAKAMALRVRARL
jgi:hypothetical protein